MTEATMADNHTAPLREILADRSCGACTACCKDLRIDTAEFQKLGDVMCQHCTGTGCGIYAERYPVCRAFLCAYRTEDWIDASLRPDSSLVLPVFLKDGVPDEYAGKPLVRFLVLDGSRLGDPALIRSICHSIEAGYATQMAVNGPRGRPGLSQLLNSVVRGVAREEWPDRVRRELRSAYDLLAILVEINSAPVTPFTHGG